MRREHARKADLRRMQELAQRVWTPERRWHVGDLAWGHGSSRDPAAAFRIALWEDGGETVAWAWVELPGSLELLVDPAHDGLVAELLDWFDDVRDGSEADCLVMEGDAAVRATLRNRGYQPRTDGPFFTRHSRDLDDLPDVEMPPAFRITAVRRDQADRRAAAHRAGWADFGSTLSTESYDRLMRTYPYRPEGDLVVIAPDGEWVASALGWYDEANAVGLVEPVSCHPEFRGRGLARAVNVALLHAFRGLGGTSAVILPRGDDAYPGPARLYRGIGYRPGPRTITYSRGQSLPH